MGRGWWPRLPVFRLEHAAPIHDADGDAHCLHLLHRRIPDGRDDQDLDGEAVSDHLSAAKRMTKDQIPMKIGVPINLTQREAHPALVI